MKPAKMYMVVIAPVYSVIDTPNMFFKGCLRAQRFQKSPYSTSTGARTDGDMPSKSRAHFLLLTDVDIAKKAN